MTVIISINDKATFGNSTDRSLQAKTGFLMDFGFTPPTTGTSSSSGSPGKLLADVNSSSSTQGQGNIDRSEQIQVSVPAVVTRVLPNGNLVIRGSQEVRVNYELRQLTIAGIVHPADISRNNTIAYDRVAEARISYGGRGRLTDVQQPALGSADLRFRQAVLSFEEVDARMAAIRIDSRRGRRRGPERGFAGRHDRRKCSLVNRDRGRRGRLARGRSTRRPPMRRARAASRRRRRAARNARARPPI